MVKQKNCIKENIIILTGYYDLVIKSQKEEIKIVTAKLEIIKDEYNKIRDNKVGLKEKIITNKEEIDIIKKLLTLKL